MAAPLFESTQLEDATPSLLGKWLQKKRSFEDVTFGGIQHPVLSSVTFEVPRSPNLPSPYHRYTWDSYCCIPAYRNSASELTQQELSNTSPRGDKLQDCNLVEPNEAAQCVTNSGATAVLAAAGSEPSPRVNPTSSSDYFGELVAELNRQVSHARQLGYNDSLQIKFPLWYRSRLKNAEVVQLGRKYGAPCAEETVSSSNEPDNDDDDSKLVPCVFSWSNGGHTVSLTGTFTNWEASPIPMLRSGQEFAVIKSLPKALHLFKFIVDGEWRYCPQQPMLTDGQQNVNNVLDLRHFEQRLFLPPDDSEALRKAVYTQVVPRSSSYTSDAPMIPVILGKSNCVAMEPPSRMSAPLHCLANHLYHDAHGAQLFGANITSVTSTQRWRQSLYNCMAGLRFSTITYITFNPLFPSHGDPAFEIQAAAPLRQLDACNLYTPHTYRRIQWIPSNLLANGSPGYRSSRQSTSNARLRIRVRLVVSCPSAFSQQLFSLAATAMLATLSHVASLPAEPPPPASATPAAVHGDNESRRLMQQQPYTSAAVPTPALAPSDGGKTSDDSQNCPPQPSIAPPSQLPQEKKCRPGGVPQPVLPNLPPLPDFTRQRQHQQRRESEGDSADTSADDDDDNDDGEAGSIASSTSSLMLSRRRFATRQVVLSKNREVSVVAPASIAAANFDEFRHRLSLLPPRPLRGRNRYKQQQSSSSVRSKHYDHRVLADRGGLPGRGFLGYGANNACASSSLPHGPRQAASDSAPAPSSGPMLLNGLPTENNALPFFSRRPDGDNHERLPPADGPPRNNDLHPFTLPPLSPRLYTLTKSHMRLLGVFVTVVFLGIFLHCGKISQVYPSLSIKDFESLTLVALQDIATSASSIPPQERLPLLTLLDSIDAKLYTPNTIGRLTVGNLLASEILITTLLAQLSTTPQQLLLNLFAEKQRNATSTLRDLPARSKILPGLPEKPTPAGLLTFPNPESAEVVTYSNTQLTCGLYDREVGAVLCTTGTEKALLEDSTNALSENLHEARLLFGCRTPPVVSAEQMKLMNALPRPLLPWAPQLLLEGPSAVSSSAPVASLLNAYGAQGVTEYVASSEDWRLELERAVLRLARTHPKIVAYHELVTPGVKPTAGSLPQLMRNYSTKLFSLNSRAPVGLSDTRVWLSGSLLQTGGSSGGPSKDPMFSEAASAAADQDTTASIFMRAAALIEQRAFHWEVHRGAISGGFIAVPWMRTTEVNHEEVSGTAGERRQELLGASKESERSLSERPLSEQGERASENRLVTLPHWLQSKHLGKRMLRLHSVSLGLISPSYPVEALLRRWITSAKIYAVLIIIWLPSLTSPQPVTLVHFPRLFFYACLCLYRAVVLYWICGRLETLIFRRFDFSDHVLFLMTVGWIAATESVAAQRSHPRIPVKPRLAAIVRSVATDDQTAPNDAPEEPLSDEEDDDEGFICVPDSTASPTALNSTAIGAAHCSNPVAGGGEHASDGPSRRQKFNGRRSLRRIQHLCTDSALFLYRKQDDFLRRICTSDNERETQMPLSSDHRRSTMKWRWPRAVTISRVMCTVLQGAVCYSCFFTALYFHHIAETVGGLLLGLLGVYIPLWLLLWTRVLRLETLGILRGAKY